MRQMSQPAGESSTYHVHGINYNCNVEGCPGQATMSTPVSCLVVCTKLIKMITSILYTIQIQRISLKYTLCRNWSHEETRDASVRNGKLFLDGGLTRKFKFYSLIDQ